MSVMVERGTRQNENGERMLPPSFFRILRHGFRDAFLTIFGGWVIWKQVYAEEPNLYLILFGFACLVPSARTAIVRILSEDSPPKSPPKGNSK